MRDQDRAREQLMRELAELRHRLAKLEASEAEHDRLQAHLIQVQRMGAMKRLAEEVAHDFNGFLTVIMGNGQFLLSELAPDDPRRADVREILAAGRRATVMTGQLTLISRQDPLQLRMLDMNQLVMDTRGILERLVGGRIELVTHLSPGLPQVEADPGRIEDAIARLARNAREAMPEGGQLTIRTEGVILGREECALMPGARPGRAVCVSIEDTGAGMEEESMQHLFEPFANGRGVGLAVAYNIVQQHEGWIDVHSEPGNGSTFKVYLSALPESQGLEIPG